MIRLPAGGVGPTSHWTWLGWRAPSRGAGEQGSSGAGEVPAQGSCLATRESRPGGEAVARVAWGRTKRTDQLAVESGSHPTRLAPALIERGRHLIPPADKAKQHESDLEPGQRAPESVGAALLSCGAQSPAATVEPLAVTVGTSAKVALPGSRAAFRPPPMAWLLPSAPCRPLRGSWTSPRSRDAVRRRPLARPPTAACLVRERWCR